MIKVLPIRYYSHFRTGKTTANSSFSYTDRFCNQWPKALVIKSIGCLSRCNNTPIPAMKASVSTSKGLLKLGNANIGAFIKAFLSARTTIVVSSVQQKLSFLSELVYGLLLWTYPLMNFT